MRNIEKNEETLARLREKASKLPLVPGVYIMKNRADRIIYVGKSKALRNRVSQYFAAGSNHDVKTATMVSLVWGFDYMLTDTEMEALALENRLIKLHTPKYNIRLKDGKSYPYIKVTSNEAYPTISVVRKRSNDGAKYFGPYSGVAQAYSIISTVRKTFMVASCKRKFPEDIGKGRPCLNRQIGLCVGPCAGDVSSEEYRDIFSDVISFLRGSYKETERSLREKMEYASENMMYEAAALYRDRICALSHQREKQKVVASPTAEHDVIGLYSDELCSCIAVFYVRGGCIVDSEHFTFPAEQIVDAEAVLGFMSELYNMREYIPHELLVGFSALPEQLESLGGYLGERAGYKVTVRRPERGNLRALCDMVNTNAEQYASQYKASSEKDTEVLVKLASVLALEVVPERIEAYDISNYGDEHITAGKIVSLDGKLCKKEYRTYKIRTSDGQDDYASMREAISRRLEHTEDEYPDLILLDGGKGHVSVIRALMREKNIDIPVYGMVKDEWHKTRALVGESEEISIAREQSLFVFIYRLQEEVHRYTVSRMNKAKRKTITTSTLERVRGIGKTKARALLLYFGGITAIKSASVDELASVKGITAANAKEIYNYYHPKQTPEGLPESGKDE